MSRSCYVLPVRCSSDEQQEVEKKEGGRKISTLMTILESGDCQFTAFKYFVFCFKIQNLVCSSFAVCSFPLVHSITHHINHITGHSTKQIGREKQTTLTPRSVLYYDLFLVIKANNVQFDSYCEAAQLSTTTSSHFTLHTSHWQLSFEFAQWKMTYVASPMACP